MFFSPLLLYLILTIAGMKKNTLIEHKEVVICEKNGPINLNYIVILITP